jgi:hypothetical protein
VTLDPAKLMEFEALVFTDTGSTEIECGEYLAAAAEILILGTAADPSTIQEDRNHFGSSDIIVSATLLNELNAQERYAFIGSLKPLNAMSWKRTTTGIDVGQRKN